MIAMLFPEKVNKEINKLKREISKLGINAELKSPPHLILRSGFDVPKNQMDEMILGFNKFIKDIRPFQIKLEGFDFIENYSNDPWIKSTFSVTIKVVKTKELEELHNKLNEFKLFSEFNVENDEEYNPCVVLTHKDLEEASFNRIKSYLKDKKINFNLNLDNITFILNRNEDLIIYKTLEI